MKRIAIIIAFLTTSVFAGYNHYSKHHIDKILSNNGYWIKISYNKYAWKPAHVSRNWKPFTKGYWYYERNNFIWKPKLVFEKVTSYYGNWIYSRKHGWIWIADYRFKPLRVKVKIKNGFLFIKPFNNKYYGINNRTRWIKYEKRIVMKRRNCRKLYF